MKIFIGAFILLCLNVTVQAQPDCNPDDTYPFIFCPGNVVHCSKHPCNDPNGFGQAVKATLPGCIRFPSGLPSGDQLKQPTQSAPGSDPDPEPKDNCVKPSTDCTNPEKTACGNDPCGTVPNPDDYITDDYPDGSDNPAYKSDSAKYVNCEDGSDGTTSHADWVCCNDWEPFNSCEAAFTQADQNWQNDHQAHDNWVTQQNDANNTAITVFDPSQAQTDAQNALNEWLAACPGKSTDGTCCIYIVFETSPQNFINDPVNVEAKADPPQCGQTGCPQRFIHVNICDQRLWPAPTYNNMPNSGYIDPTTGNVRSFSGMMFFTGGPGTSAPSGQAPGYHTTSFFSLMEHEMGHWLGFSHLNMYPCTTQNDFSIMSSNRAVKDLDPIDIQKTDRCMFEKLYCDPYCPTNGVTTKNKISLPLIIGIKPNPSTGATTASYTLEVPTKVIISILDIQGKEIIQVFSGEQPDGEYNFSLPTQYLASGTYVCRIQAGNNEATAKIILTK